VTKNRKFFVKLARADNPSDLFYHLAEIRVAIGDHPEHPKGSQKNNF